MTGQGSMTGTVLGDRYEVKDRIGIGGMAEVYRGQDSTLGRVVAVKVMLPQFAADPSFTQRFRQEAAAAANLQSPYIVNVYDWGHDGDTYYIVMEYVRGSDLKTAIQQRGAINQRKAAEIGSQVCQALTVAHNQDIIHRDIKPQNIMVQPDGNVKVMDFGIARAKNSVKDKTAAVLGTAHYISPEQAQGKDLTAASDIYSLGIVLYEATTGRLPFDGPDAVSVAMQQVKDEPVPPSSINPAIDPDLEDIIMVALAKDPTARFATANDMRVALQEYLAGRPVTLPAGAMGSSFTEAQTRMMNTVPTQAPGVAATQVMPGVSGRAPMGMSPTTAMPPSSTGTFQPTDFHSANTKKSKMPLVVALIAILAVVAIAGVAYALVMGGGGAPVDEPIEVPNVVDSTKEEARFTLEQAGFKVVTEPEVDESVAENTVLRQNPAAGTKQPKGSTITLTVAVGPEKVTVPNFKNMTLDEAKIEAGKANVQVVEAESKYSDDVDEGKIISQDIDPGEEVDPGKVIEVVVSRGKGTTKAPRVIGYEMEAAISTLENAGFQVDVTNKNATSEDYYSDTIDKGCVMKQDPLNDEAKPGSTVSITISSGPKPEPEEPEEPEPPANDDNNANNNDANNNDGNAGGNAGGDNNNDNQTPSGGDADTTPGDGGAAGSGDATGGDATTPAA